MLNQPFTVSQLICALVTPSPLWFAFLARVLSLTEFLPVSAEYVINAFALIEMYTASHTALE